MLLSEHLVRAFDLSPTAPSGNAAGADVGLGSSGGCSGFLLTRAYTFRGELTTHGQEVVRV